MAQKTRLTQQDLQIYPSERLTDTDDGGGLMRGTPLTGTDNELFNPVSDVDRTMGSVDARLVYPGVLRNDAEPLYGAHFVISEPPKADNVAYLAFKANNYGELRKDIMPRIEAYSVPTIESTMTLLGNQLKGSRLVQAYQREEATVPLVGQRYCLQSKNATQYIRLVNMNSELRTFEYVNINGTVTEFRRRVLKMEISDALVYDFIGVDYPVIGKADVATKILETQVADTANYFGVKQLTEAIAKGVASLKINSIYEKLVPTSTVEQAFVDQYPVGAGVWIPTAGRRQVAHIWGSYYGDIYLDTSVQPGSVEMNGYVDNARGQLVNGSTIVSIDYDAGVIRNMPYIYEPTVYAVPAAYANNANYTTILPINEANQGTEWAPLLTPKPAQGATAVSFMTGGNWYDLKDYGDYKLRDAEGNVHGTIERSGSVVLSLPALPDVDSNIIFAWSPLNTFKTVDGSEPGSVITFPPTQPQSRLQSNQLQNMKPGTLQIAWNVDNAGKSATDDHGALKGDVGGVVDYNQGIITLNFAPITQYTVTAEVFTGQRTSSKIVINSGGDLVSGNVGVFQPGTLILDLDVTFIDTVTKRGFKMITGDIVMAGGNATRSRVTTHRYAHSITDDGEGNLILYGAKLPGATINYLTGSFSIPTAALARTGLGARFTDVQILLGTTPVSITDDKISNGKSCTYEAQVGVSANVSVIGTSSTRSVTVQITNSDFVINVLSGKPWPRQAVLNSWVLMVNGTRLIERNGTFYKNIDPKTGNGTAVGTLDALSGEITFTDTTLNTGMVTVVSGVYANYDLALKQYYGRTPAAPIKPQSLTVYSQVAGVTKVGMTQADESITGDFTGAVNTETGFFRLNCNEHFMPDTLRFNVVTQSNMPLDSSIIGIDAVRLPPDGRVPIFRKGDMIVISNKESHELGTAFTANQTVSLGRDDIDRVAIVDAKNQQVDANKYEVDLDAGTLTWAKLLDLSAYTMPLTAYTMREEENRVVAVDISGKLKLQFETARAYPMEHTYVSSALISGDMLVRASAPFSQQAWTKVWSDERIGDQILAKLNVKDYPFRLISAGAITERWLILFTSATQFSLYGENLGLIMSSDIVTTLSPVNPATGKPYFTLPKEAFGGGWQTSNCIRFNTYGTPMPTWILRSVQPSPTAQNTKDGFVGCLRGNTIDI